jgi:hypothetical protein
MRRHVSHKGYVPKEQLHLPQEAERSLSLLPRIISGMLEITKSRHQGQFLTKKDQISRKQHGLNHNKNSRCNANVEF